MNPFFNGLLVGQSSRLPWSHRPSRLVILLGRPATLANCDRDGRSDYGSRDGLLHYPNENSSRQPDVTGYTPGA